MILDKKSALRATERFDDVTLWSHPRVDDIAGRCETESDSKYWHFQMNIKLSEASKILRATGWRAVNGVLPMTREREELGADWCRLVQIGRRKAFRSRGGCKGNT